MPSLHLNLEVGPFFCLTEGKVPHKWPVYCHRHLFSLEVLEVLILIRPFHALFCVIFDTNQDEEKYFFSFYELVFLAKPQIPLHCIFLGLSMHMLLPF